MDNLPLPPTTHTFGPQTPSCLTPNTRSEAEAQLSLNTASQTDSAAPTTPLPYRSTNPFHHHPSMASGGSSTAAAGGAGMSEAQSAYHDVSSGPPAGTGTMTMTSSSNYEAALLQHHQDEAARRHRKESTTSTASTVSESSPASPVSSFTTRPFPEPGQGVVPLGTGVGGNAEQGGLKRSRPQGGGWSLGELGRTQSWSAQDRRHEVYQGRLLAPADAAGEGGDAGYSSGTEGRAVGP